MGSPTPRQSLKTPNGGISGRPSLARYVEVTYEGMLSLKTHLDRIETRLSQLEASTKSASRPAVPNRRGR